MAKMNQEKVAQNIQKLTGVSKTKAKKSAAKFMKKRRNKSKTGRRKKR